MRAGACVGVGVGGWADVLMNLDLNFFAEHRQRLVPDSVPLNC